MLKEMKILKKNLLKILSLSLLVSCIPQQAQTIPQPISPQPSAIVSTTPSPSATQPSATPLPRPTQYKARESDNTPATPTPIPRACADLPSQPSIEQAQGLAVSPDGKTVYLSAYLEGQGSYLYQLEEGQPLKVLDLSQTEVACSFHPELLNKNSSGQLYLLIEKFKYLHTQEYKVFKLDPQNTPLQPKLYFHKVFFAADATAPDPSLPGSLLSTERIEDLFIDEKDQLYVLFDSRNIEFPSILYRLAPPETQNSIFYYYGQASGEKITFDAYNEKLYIDSILYETPPYPKDYSHAKYIFSKQPYPLKGRVVKNKFRNQRIFVVTNDGTKSELFVIQPDTQTTQKIAGYGSSGYFDGRSELAQFREIIAMDLDNNENIYVLDRGNKAIRKITPAGMVSTFYKAPTD